MTTTIRASKSIRSAALPPPGSRRLPGVAHRAVLATVHQVEPPRPLERLVWGTADGRTVLFTVDERTAREYEAAIAAAEEPTAIVEPEQVVAVDIDTGR